MPLHACLANKVHTTGTINSWPVKTENKVINPSDKNQFKLALVEWKTTFRNFESKLEGLERRIIFAGTDNLTRARGSTTPSVRAAFTHNPIGTRSRTPGIRAAFTHNPIGTTGRTPGIRAACTHPRPSKPWAKPETKQSNRSKVIYRTVAVSIKLYRNLQRNSTGRCITEQKIFDFNNCLFMLYHCTLACIKLYT